MYLSRFVLSGNEIFYTTLYSSFCDDCLKLGTLKLLFPKKTFVTILIILKAGVFTMITLNLSDIFDNMNIPMTLVLYNHVLALTGTKEMP